MNGKLFFVPREGKAPTIDPEAHHRKDKDLIKQLREEKDQLKKNIDWLI